MLVISSREFRDNQKSYLDKVDEGIELLIQRGKNKSYKIIPVTKDDTLMTKEEFFAITEKAIINVKEGRTYAMKPQESLEDFLKRMEEEGHV